MARLMRKAQKQKQNKTKIQVAAKLHIYTIHDEWMNINSDGYPVYTHASYLSSGEG